MRNGRDDLSVSPVFAWGYADIFLSSSHFLANKRIVFAALLSALTSSGEVDACANTSQTREHVAKVICSVAAIAASTGLYAMLISLSTAVRRRTWGCRLCCVGLLFGWRSRNSFPYHAIVLCYATII